VRWLKLAAEQGHAGAQNDFGVMLNEGAGIARDPIEAAKWFVEAAKGGNELADYNLEGIFEELTALAEAGDETAKKAVGEAYLKGIGVDQDLELGKKWLGGWLQ
jgi:TPR repeat protein